MPLISHVMHLQLAIGASLIVIIDGKSLNADETNNDEIDQSNLLIYLEMLLNKKNIRKKYYLLINVPFFNRRQ